jgi:hypothetical protein
VQLAGSSAGKTTAAAVAMEQQLRPELLEQRFAELTEQKEKLKTELAGQQARAAQLELNVVQLQQEADAKVPA